MGPGYHWTQMVHEGPEHQVILMILQGPEYHYIPEVREVRTTAMIRIVTITMMVMMIRITVVEKLNDSIVEEEENVI